MSFREVIATSLGQPGVLTMQLSVIINNLGGLVVFLIIIGDVLAGRGDKPGLLTPLG
jgi:sodium-coupled neutral amino acid transporter 2